MTADSPREDEDLEASKAPLIEHLLELRSRLIWSMLAIALAFAGCYMVSGEIYNFLVKPLADVLQGHPNKRMIYTGMHEAFFTRVKLSFFAAIMLAFPIIASQIYMFVAPGLYKNERRAFFPFLVATPILFLAGAALAYYFVFPAAWSFFISFEVPQGQGALPIELEPKVNEYLSLVMTLIFAFGLSFQLPILLVLLGRAGIVTARGLAEKRKYAIVGIFLAAAILTPPDPFTQIGLGVPILLLYEISILLIRMIERKSGSGEPKHNDE